MTKAQVGEERVVWFTHFSITVHLQRRSVRNLEAGVDAEAMEGAAYELASPGLLKLLSFRTQDHQAREDPIHNGLSPPASITMKRPYSWGGILSTEVPFIQKTLACAKSS